MKVLIPYSSKDTRIAQELAQALSHHAIHPVPGPETTVGLTAMIQGGHWYIEGVKRHFKATPRFYGFDFLAHLIACDRPEEPCASKNQAFVTPALKPSKVIP